MIISMDDGSLRLFGFDKSATDTPFTGQPFTGTLYQGLHSYYCSFYAMWGVHIARESGKPLMASLITLTVQITYEINLQKICFVIEYGFCGYSWI